MVVGDFGSGPVSAIRIRASEYSFAPRVASDLEILVRSQIGVTPETLVNGSTESA
jgi:hypothetical protein